MKRLLIGCLLALAWPITASAQTDAADPHPRVTFDPSDAHSAAEAGRAVLAAMFINLTPTGGDDHYITFSAYVAGKKCSITMVPYRRPQDRIKKNWRAADIQCER